MKINKVMLGILTGTSLFIGFVIISVAVGAIFPSMHKLTAPLICSGEVKVESIQYYPPSGGVGWKNYIYCIEQGNEKEITFPAIGVTGLVYSAITFVVLLFLGRKAVVSPENFGELATDIKPKKTGMFGSEKKKDDSALERLSQLKKMRDENLISQVEYERKKAEIMEEL